MPVPTMTRPTSPIDSAIARKAALSAPTSTPGIGVTWKAAMAVKWRLTIAVTISAVATCRRAPTSHVRAARADPAAKTTASAIEAMT